MVGLQFGGCTFPVVVVNQQQLLKQLGRSSSSVLWRSTSVASLLEMFIQETSFRCVCVCFYSALCPTNSCQSFAEEELLFWKPSHGNARTPLLIPTLNPKNPRSQDNFQLCFFFSLFAQQNLAQALQKKIVCCFWKPRYGNERNPQLTNPKPQKSKESREEGRKKKAFEPQPNFVCLFCYKIID